jgi:hypothetical protein
VERINQPLHEEGEEEEEEEEGEEDALTPSVEGCSYGPG